MTGNFSTYLIGLSIADSSTTHALLALRMLRSECRKMKSACNNIHQTVWTNSGFHYTFKNKLCTDEKFSM